MRKTWIAILLLVIRAEGADTTYVTAKLTKVLATDLSAPMHIPPLVQNGSALDLTIPLGVMYQFTVEADGITYLAACTSKAKKSWFAEWIVNDPIQFRVHKDEFFLRRPNGKELRLLLMTRIRPTKSEDGDLSKTSEITPQSTSRQNIPECR
jgi:hypothetical protein